MALTVLVLHSPVPECHFPVLLFLVVPDLLQVLQRTKLYYCPEHEMNFKTEKGDRIQILLAEQSPSGGQGVLIQDSLDCLVICLISLHTAPSNFTGPSHVKGSLTGYNVSATSKENWPEAKSWAVNLYALRPSL